MTASEIDVRGEDSEAWTIRRVLSWASSDFSDRGFEAPGLEAELLLSHALGSDRVRLIIDSTRALGRNELDGFRELIKRRRAGEPIAYILGYREFYGLQFRVDPRVLIPRPDTETLVELALKRTEPRSLFCNALDLCTGSGCVAVALAKARPTWRVTATDISRAALEAALHNAQRLGAAGTMRFLHSDLFAALEPGMHYDLVTCNPPYIRSGELAGLTNEIRDFEPQLALDGGEDGLHFTRRVIAEAREHLAPNGILALEVGYDQAQEVRHLLEAAGFTALETQRDYGGRERVVSACCPQVMPAPSSFDGKA